jgi:hypothetical protein
VYKKITHSIVEEHFDHPLAVKMSQDVNKAQWKAPLRYYSDGTQIPTNLPMSYRLATSANGCMNCLAFNSATTMCSKWSEPVRPDYVCDAWTPITA